MTIDENVAHTQKIFSDCSSEEKHEKIIELGRKLDRLPSCFKVDENLVSGCQSKLYLRSYFNGGKIYFEAEADALISAGLAALLIGVYSGQPPEEVVKHNASFLKELGLESSLSMTRAGGLSHILLRMKQDALKQLVSQN